MPIDSEAGRTIRDELHYYLPVERARDALTRHEAAAVDEALAPVSGYLEGHPRRFEMIRQVEALAESSRMLRHAVRANAQSRLRQLQIALIQFYMETGECPADVAELSRWIADAGVGGADGFTAESLEARAGGCSARVRSAGGESHELRWP